MPNAEPQVIAEQFSTQRRVSLKLRQTADWNCVKLPIEIASNCRLAIDCPRGML